MADNTILYGKWYFNDTIDYMGVPNTYVNFAFVDSNDNIVRCRRMYDYTGNGMFTYETEEGSWYFPSPTSWEADSMYRTIWITGGGTDTFLTWLKANATKVSESLDPEESMTNAQLYNRKMGELVDIINEKADSSGNENLDGLINKAKTLSNKPNGTLEIIKNGTYNVSLYSGANVNVPAGIVPSGTKNINSNGTHDITEYASVDVSVPVGVFPSGTLNVSYNGTFDVYHYSKAIVNIETTNTGDGQGIEDVLNKTITGIFSSPNVKSIPNGFFSNCTKLEGINLENCESIGSSTFYTCYSLSMALIPNIKTLGENAFANCSKLLSIELPYVLNIFNSAFASCFSLSYVSIPCCKEIYSYAFANCSKLKEVYAPNVAFIRSGAIGGGLSKIDFPYCYYIEYAYWGNSNTSYLSLPNCTTFNGTLPYNSIYLPFVTFGELRMQNSEEKIIDFPFLLSTGTYPFVSCYNATDINLPLLSCFGGSYGCSGCSNLVNINAPHISNYVSNCFRNCVNLSSIIAPAVSNIGSYALYNCNNLQKLTLLYNRSIVTLANSNAFHSTPMLDSSYLGYYGSIFVPSSMIESYKMATNWAIYADRFFPIDDEIKNKYIITGEFSRTNITEIPVEKQNALVVGASAFYNCPSLISINLPNCETIGNAAFLNCTSLQTISLPNCENFGTYCFQSCNKLINVELEKCKGLPQADFLSCTGLQTISLPNCSYVGSSVFYNCSSLSSIYMPKLVLIGQQAFYNTKLTQIDLSECLYIHNDAFYNCKSLVSVNAPKCTYLGQNAFSNCISLQTINVSNCKNLGYAAFYNCSSLKEILIKNCEYIQINAFYNCSSLSVYLLNSSKICLFTGSPFTRTNNKIYVHENLYSYYINNKIYSSFNSLFVSMTNEEILSKFPNIYDE